MWKKIFILIGILLALVYLVVAMTWFNREPSDVVCSGVELRLQSNAHHADFITQAGLKDLLEKGKLYPMGWRMDSVRCRDIEAYLMQNPFIKSAECYKTPAGHVCVEVAQRVPVFRVMGADGAQFYLDDKGGIIPHSGYAVHLPVVTGSVTKQNADSLLHELNRIIRHDSFWEDQIEQVHVTPAGELELVPRVGDHIVFLGSPEGVEAKLTRLKTFYKKALNRVGWNKYACINLEFGNQVICTQK